ncbi:MAG: hypothetical protein LBH79_06415 [Nitrososphaerota archaeon]|nr:hypothetical protein [Nitrososphaerota archaeon]
MVQKARCFFLDANLVLSDILNENNPRLAKLKNDAHLNKIPCYISDSVKNEVKSKVQRTTDFLGTAIRETVYTALVESRDKRKIPSDAPIDFSDVKALEDLFSEYHVMAKRQGSLTGPLMEVEQWSIQFIADKLDKGLTITIDGFLLELTKTVLLNISTIADVCDNLVEFEKGHIKTKVIAVDERVKQIARIAEGYGIHAPDSLHVACVHQYQALKNEQAVFATRDYGIIKQKNGLWERKIHIEISDPLYAFYHF